MIVDIVAGFDGGELLLLLMLLGGIETTPPPPLPVGCVERLSIAGVIGIFRTPVEFMKEM